LVAEAAAALAASENRSKELQRQRDAVLLERDGERKRMRKQQGKQEGEGREGRGEDDFDQALADCERQLAGKHQELHTLQHRARDLEGRLQAAGPNNHPNHPNHRYQVGNPFPVAPPPHVPGHRGGQDVLPIIREAEAVARAASENTGGHLQAAAMLANALQSKEHSAGVARGSHDKTVRALGEAEGRVSSLKQALHTVEEDLTSLYQEAEAQQALQQQHGARRAEMAEWRAVAGELRNEFHTEQQEHLRQSQAYAKRESRGEEEEAGRLDQGKARGEEARSAMAQRVEKASAAFRELRKVAFHADSRHFDAV